MNEDHQRKKPPLGVMPEAIFEQRRCEDLARAILEYLQAGLVPLPEWIDELLRRIKSENLTRRIP